MIPFVLFIGIRFLALVNGHPLMPSVHQCPAVNYPPNLYRPLNSEAIIIQPSNNSPYSQQVLINNPLPTYQISQVPPLLDQIMQIYWDKFLSNPTIRNLIDTNQILNNYYGKNIKTNSHPYNTGGVVNNYIILPPDYLKENTTLSRIKKPKRLRNKSNRQLKGTLNCNERKKKIFNPQSVQSQVIESPKTIKNRKTEQNTEKSWNFSIENIKCFTPADVLYNERYEPKTKNNRKYEDNTQSPKEKRNKNKKPSTESTSEVKPEKKKKVKNNNGKKNKINDSREKTEDNTSLSTTGKKMKRRKKVLGACECVNDELSNCAANIPEDNPEICKQNINDILLTNLLQQGCCDSENRRTRNSKTNAAKTDFLNVYPDLSDDISKSLTWYMNGYFSPHVLQQPSHTNFLRNNMYPLDLSQMYQIPQYSNVNRSNGNTKNTKRKKKKKNKNSKPKQRIENASESEENNSPILPKKSVHIEEIDNEVPMTSTQISELNTQVPETTTIISETQISETNSQIPDKGTQVLKTNTQVIATGSQVQTSTPILEASTQTPEKSTQTKLDTTVGVTIINNERVLVETTSDRPTENVTTETPMTKSFTSMDEVIQYLKKLIKDNNIHIEDTKTLKTFDQNEGIINLKSQEENLKKLEEIYETQIPESVEIPSSNKNNTGIIEEKERSINEIPYPLDFFNLNQERDLELEEIHNVFDNRLMYDYYPDFKADNHAYLDHTEEINLRNIHNRYFYTTDKNIDSREIGSSEEVNQFCDKKLISIENESRNENVMEKNNVKDIADEKDKSHEIVFRIPPGLEVPDFITRKINRDEQDSTEIYYHHNNYNGDFDRFNLDNFADKSDHYVTATDRIQTKCDNKHDSLVETVYARSKVVKYGQGQEIDKPFKDEVKSDFPTVGDVAIQNDGEKTIIIAKSLGPEDFW